MRMTVLGAIVVGAVGAVGVVGCSSSSAPADSSSEGGGVPSSSGGGTTAPGGGTTSQGGGGQAGVLTAGIWDDNLNYDFFTSYLASHQGQNALPGDPGFTQADYDAAHSLFAQRTPFLPPSMPSSFSTPPAAWATSSPT